MMLAFEPMRRVILALMMVAALPALAQKEEIFGSGKPVKYREENMDKRFAKSRLAKLLAAGTDDPACVQLLGGLFVALAEVGPVFHKRDENFTLDPALQEALQTQLSTPGFPGTAYFVSMVRRVLIDGRLSDEWLATAEALNKSVRIIDMGKLKLMNEGLSPVDSAYFTIPLLKQRFYVEVTGASSAVTTDVEASFRDTYLDRDVAWGGAVLLDAGLNAPKGSKKKKLKPSELAEIVAILEWLPPDPRKSHIDLLNTRPVKPEPIRIIARLAPKQYLDLEKAFKGQRLMVRGRFWEMNKTVTELEVRDAVLFDDRDWGQGVVLADPNVIARCPAAINELTGTAPVQPGGFKH